MEPVYLIGGLRSRIGVEGGLYRSVPAEDLGAAVLNEIWKRYPAARRADLIIGANAVGGGGNITRLAALKAGIGADVPSVTVDMQCASGAAAIGLGMAKIASGLADIVVAGGFESSSMQPLRVYSPKDPRYDPAGFKVAQFSPSTNSPRVMLEGAERCAQKGNFTREELDLCAIRSHRLAIRAREEGVLGNIVVDIFGADRDEGIRDRMGEKLARRMPTLFTADEAQKLWPGAKEPLTTAANACLTDDGAAFVVLAGKRALDGASCALRLLDVTEAGVDPDFSPEGAGVTAQKLLQRNGLEAKDIDAFEYNEAFAVISAIFKRRHPDLFDRFCPLGGALAYGHPYGASGAILLLHLWADLMKDGAKRGILSIAGAGGLGCAILAERV